MSGRQRDAIAPPWRVIAYVGAVVTLVLALFSPVDRLADQSFAWHMAQHLSLMLVAGPLLALGNAHLVALLALPLGPRRKVGRSINSAPVARSAAGSPFSPPVAALVFAAGLWLWHAPSMFEAALADPILHTVEHLTFLVTSAVFWRMVSTAGDRRMSGMSALVLVTLVCLQGNLLAALLTLAPQPIYQTYAANRLADQQLAGLLMWLPAGLIYLVSSLWALRSLFAPRARTGP
ncbi:cytochrome c oxidase assembly protein [Qipengyuania sp. YG27]|uniref:Cytochrome c oxidase assembly protein n=2 Tax=Qipengyuania mesophila TaxID=2867246 RepID=A0ABS7JRZ3_9SPHN|nr:cytochrome c oxidase assembly protein [Qipengyuania mesophila]